MAGAAHDDDLDAILALTPDQRVERAVQKLPTLSAQDVPLQDSCPICLLPFPSIISGENVEPESPGELVGVTKLQGCGHVFCRLECVTGPLSSSAAH
ncbi:uncharacterized protein PHACADRAFT_250610 [Phanerochaete carnosa HHB-10118-sp]|uniref:Uncharacterized protein n=1 Tax=Phanerochaete carnosa (strain HHB-10118-sp) TaxID=650164 RepID=K5VAH4_PHACS|nr:uncharacterized protein PHACADRAFT_250610 [Phanerochaete carnosa HHB-10118-sp]EKM59846.1 hypothetical protein PHACADRAFT_250610 [Phanerochaete carnosa HHB-10118-sp]